MSVSRAFLHIFFRVPSKGSCQYFVEVGFIILTFLITQFSPTACNWYLVPNTVSRTLFGPNIVFRNLFGPLSFSDNCSSYYSLQKPLRPKYNPQKAVRSQYCRAQTLQPTIVPRRLLGRISVPVLSCPNSSAHYCPQKTARSNIFLRTLFSFTLDLCSSFIARDQVLHFVTWGVLLPHKTMVGRTRDYQPKDVVAVW
jgi:hypothetical protein